MTCSHPCWCHFFNPSNRSQLLRKFSVFFVAT
ncbi:hypothetical protein Alsa1_CDS0146 [Staphylococcus phage Alsa_1]|nr:hypothetical protein Alsa1_CDS0146 [Staphylococcus phage Alsa_1]